MFKLTPSLLSNYQFKHDLALRNSESARRLSPDLTKDELLELVTPAEPNDAMRIGMAVHQYLELGHTEGCKFGIADKSKLDDLRHVFITENADTPQTEVKLQKGLSTPFGDAVMSGMADVLYIDRGIDWKVSVKKRNAETYFNSVQAFAYLWLFEVDRWNFTTLQAIMHPEQASTIQEVRYGNTVSVPATNRTEYMLMDWIISLLADLQRHELLNHITL